MKITLLSEDAIRVEAIPGTMTMQFAFSNRSCGIPLSGVAIISSKTFLHLVLKEISQIEHILLTREINYHQLCDHLQKYRLIRCNNSFRLLH